MPMGPELLDVVQLKFSPLSLFATQQRPLCLCKLHDPADLAFVAAFRATPPYDELSPAINVFRVNVASTDSGADDPTATGGTGASVRTYFDATFGANGIRRLLVSNATTALTVAAAQVPEFTVVLVVVNSTVYGGSGGSIASQARTCARACRQFTDDTTANPR